MANKEYRMPIVLDEGRACTSVWIKGFEIKNRNAFSIGDAKESQLNLELTFNSNDYTTEKYTQFMKEFTNFLVENGWIEGKRY
ncbi:hypothetical protein [Bacillus sonorensis]|uniref:hypothetical protein n=1 Tax=Bacillus subtilis group TaxID=653685 RepID=UPI00098A85D7|nr:hypothetical protein [Bacillus sonorensis]